jgi:hypothetical protein
MTPDVALLNLHVDAGPGADPEEFADVARHIRNLLLDRDVPRVEFARAGELPTGVKGDVVTLSTLVVTLGPVALKGVIDILQSWLSRHERVTVTVESGGEKLTITGTPTREQQQTVAAFLNRQKV